MKVLYINNLNKCDSCGSSENLPHRVMSNSHITPESGENVMCSQIECKNTGKLSGTKELSVIWDKNRRTLSIEHNENNTINYIFK